MPPKKPAKVKAPKEHDEDQTPKEPAESKAPEPETPAAAQPPHPPPDVKAILPPIVENLMAPEFFATEAQSISLVNGMISIAFSSSRYDYSETPSVLKKVVVSRVVMSPVGAQSLAVRLFAFLDQKGFSAAPKDPKQRQ
jgi:hypothetical protein